MSIGSRWWGLVMLLVGCGNAVALLAIQGTVVIEPPAATLLRGETATITYTVTNTGDEPLDSATSGTGYYEWGPMSTVLPAPNSQTPPCVTQFFDFSPRPGEPAFIVNTNSFLPRPIPPGESRQCVLDLVVSPEAKGPFIQRFGFTGSRGALSVNVGEDVMFNLGQETIAVPALQWPGMALMAMMTCLLAAGFWRDNSSASAA